MILKALVLKSLNLTKVVECFSMISANQLNELKTRALSKFVVVVMFFVNIIKSDGQEISAIEWQELRNRFPSFFVLK